MPAFSLHLNHQLVTISASDAALLAHFSEYFRYYRLPESLPEKIHEGMSDENGLTLDLRLVQTPPPHASGAELIAQTGVLSLWRTIDKPETFSLCAGDTTFVIEPSARRAVGYIGAGAMAVPPILTNTYSLFALLLLLRWRGVYHVHAGAVVTPDDRLCWLAGEQRSGKTTLVTALGLAGWRPLADDSLLWHWHETPRAGEGVNLTAHKKLIWQPLRKAFHLGHEALSHWQRRLDKLSTQPRYLDRQSAAALEFFGTRPLAEQAHARVDAMFFPQVSAARHTIISALAPAAALRVLAEQSTYFPVWRAHTQAQFAGLSHCLRGAKSYRVMAGTDVFDEPERVAEMLLRALGE